MGFDMLRRSGAFATVPFVVLVLLVPLLSNLVVRGETAGDPKDAEIRMLRASAKHQAEEIEPLRRKLADAQRKLLEAEKLAKDAAAAAGSREADLRGQIDSLNKRLDELTSQLTALKKE